MKNANRLFFIASYLLISGAALSRAAVVVSPPTAQLKPGASIQFSATGSSNGVYLWSVTGSGCLGYTCGIITANGFYTAPTIIPQPGMVTVTATSLADLSQHGSATVTIGTQPIIGVAVSPSEVNVNLGGEQLFTANVTGTTNTAVTWSLSGVTCAGTACGTITSSGLYTAPSSLPVSNIVYVKATSKADTSKSAKATVNLINSIGVTISPTSAKLNVGGSQQFTAHVTGTPVTGVSWGVSGSGCSGIACGTITSGGLYMAPATAPNPPVVTVKATLMADSNASATALVTIGTPVGISITPKSVAVLAGEQVQFHDTITGTTNTAVTWSVSGALCTGSACGTISSTGLYTAPANPSAQMLVTVTVTSKASPSVSTSAAVTVLRANNSKLNGRYAIFFQGVDQSGVFEEAASIDADGNGKILNGKEDVNRTINPATDLSVTGTYQISSDNRGVLTIHGPLGTQTLRIALNSSGVRGRLESFDQSGVRGSGVIYKQDPTAFDPSALTGGYVLSLSGANVSGQRVGALGLVFPDGFGFISGSTLDVNEGGVVPPTFASFSGIYDVDASGRGTMTLSVPGFDGGLFHFAFYVVSQTRLLFVSTDPISVMNPILGGPAQSQIGAPFSISSFSGGTIFSLTGSSAGGGDDTIGRMVFSPGNNIFVNFDRNNAGDVSTGGVLTGAYDMQLNGRGNFNLDDPSNGAVHIWLLYAIAPNTGFLMDISSSAVGMGEVTPQVNVPFSNGTLIGTYVLGSGDPIVKTTPLLSGRIDFDGGNSRLGNGSVSGTADLSLPASLLSNQPVAGTYALSPVMNNGRGSIVLTTPQPMNIAIWASGSAGAVGLEVDDNATHPVVLHIDQ